jgi:hypothetical protein
LCFVLSEASALQLRGDETCTKAADFFARRPRPVKKTLFSIHITGDLAGNEAQVHQMFH